MYNAKQTLEIKQSNNISFVVNYTDDAGAPLSLADITIDADIKDSGRNLLAVMQVAILNAETGFFELTLPQDTQLPLKMLYMDIRFSENGVVRNSDIVQLNVKEVVTSG